MMTQKEQQEKIQFFGFRDFSTLVSVENGKKLNVYLEEVIDWASKDINSDTVGAVTELIQALQLS